MSFVATAIVATAASTIYSSSKARKAQKDAQRRAEIQANKDAKNARRAEVFAETEGEGVGSLGRISLEVDDQVDVGVRKKTINKSTLRV